MVLVTKQGNKCKKLHIDSNSSPKCTEKRWTTRTTLLAFNNSTTSMKCVDYGLPMKSINCRKLSAVL